MRFVFGLGGVLITIGVIVVIMKNSTLPAAKQAINVKTAAEKVLVPMSAAGIQDARASITFDQITKDGKFDSLIVTSIVPGGPMQARYGLLPGDTIIKFNNQKVSDVVSNDPLYAEDMVFEAYAKQYPLGVIRNGSEITLPQPTSATPSNPPANPPTNTGPLGPLKGVIPQQ